MMSSTPRTTGRTASRTVSSTARDAGSQALRAAGRQLLDDFGVDTDSAGYAHIVYSHDAPSLGGASSYTGYAVQTGGQALGTPNN